MFLVGDGVEAARGLPGGFESERGGDSTLDWSVPVAYDCALNAELCGRLAVNALNSSAVSLLCLFNRCLFDLVEGRSNESSGRCNTCWSLTVDDEGATALKTPAGEVTMASGRVGGFE